MPFGNARQARKNLTRRAVAALERVVLDECGVKWMQNVALRQPFDSRHFRLIAGRGEGQAGEHPSSVDEDGASSAGAMVAAFLAAGKVKMLAQQVEERCAHIHRDRLCGSIDS